MPRSAKIFVFMTALFCRTGAYALDIVPEGRSTIASPDIVKHIIYVDFRYDNNYKDKYEYIYFDLDHKLKYAIPNGYLTIPEQKHQGPNTIRHFMDVGMWGLSGNMIIVGKEFNPPRIDGISNNDFAVWISQVRDDGQKKRIYDSYYKKELIDNFKYKGFEVNIEQSKVEDLKNNTYMVGETKSGWRVLFIYTDPEERNSYCGKTKVGSGPKECDDTTRMHGYIFNNDIMYDVKLPAIKYKNFSKVIEIFDEKLKEWSTFN